MNTARHHAQPPTRSKPASSRSRMIAAIHIEWAKIRRDLGKASHAELRDERLAYITRVLKLKRQVNSMRDLTDRQLGLVLDALRNFQPQLPGDVAHAAAQPATEGAEIIHLASAEQVFTINKLLDHLGWSVDARERFIQQRFRRTSPAMLSPKQANSLTMILLNIAAQRAIRTRGIARVSRAMIQAEIPRLKERLGIGIEHKESEEEVDD